MRRGVDTNVLVYAHVVSMPQHEVARHFLERELAKKDARLVVTAGVLHEFVHVITDARRFDPPVTMAEAIALATEYVDRSNVECVAIDEHSVKLALDLLHRHGLGRKRIADTLFAATLITHGVGEIITTNPRDFEVFEGLRTRDPLSRR